MVRTQTTSMKKAHLQVEFRWWFPAWVAACSVIAFLPLIVNGSDFAGLLYVFVTIPVVSLTLLTTAFRQKGKQRVAALAAFTIFVFFTATLFKNFYSLRNRARWFAYSEPYMRAIAAQPVPASGKLKHIEWDGWGFTGAGDTVVYLVFDPSNSLAVAAKTHEQGKYSGLPCEVVRVQRLEDDWYTVLFYTDTDWDDCP